MVLKITNLHILRYLPTYWLYLLERYTIDNQRCTHTASGVLELLYFSLQGFFLLLGLLQRGQAGFQLLSAVRQAFTQVAVGLQQDLGERLKQIINSFLVIHDLGIFDHNGLLRLEGQLVSGLHYYSFYVYMFLLGHVCHLLKTLRR